MVGGNNNISFVNNNNPHDPYDLRHWHTEKVITETERVIAAAVPLQSMTISPVQVRCEHYRHLGSEYVSYSTLTDDLGLKWHRNVLDLPAYNHLRAWGIDWSGFFKIPIIWSVTVKEKLVIANPDTPWISDVIMGELSETVIPFMPKNDKDDACRQKHGFESEVREWRKRRIDELMKDIDALQKL